MQPDELKPNVLVVDDQRTNLIAMQAILWDMPINLALANSGEQALTYLLENDCSIVLLDVRMPGMDGFETAELIRQRPRSHLTPILFVTAAATEDADRLRGYRIGAADFVTKPINTAILRAKVGVFVDLFNAHAQIERQARQLHELEQLEHLRAIGDERRRLKVESSARQMAEQALSRSKVLFETFMDNCPAVIFLKNAQGQYVFVNTKWTTCFGHTVEHFLGKTDFDIWPLAIATQFMENDKHVLAENTAHELFETSALENGEERSWLVAKFPVNDTEGNRLLGGIAVDITARKKEEANLRRMATVVRDSNDAITIQDFEGRITAWNRGAELMYGYSEEEAFQMNIGRLTAPGKIEEQKDFTRRLVAGEAITSFETQRVTKDERVLDIWMTVTKLMDDAGELIGIASTERDITERKRVDEEIRKLNADLERRVQERTAALCENEDRFRTLANNISQLAWMADAQGAIFWYNQRWFDYTGTTIEEMRGWGWQKVHHPDHVQRVVDKIKQCFETGEVWEDTFPLRGTDGHYRWFLSRAVPIRDEHGMVFRWFGTNTDITEHKQAEERIEQLNADLHKHTAQLEAANKELESFSYSVSHDLRAPLRHVQGYVDMLAREAEGQLSDKGRHYMKTIEDASREMGVLIDDLLAFSRMGRADMIETTVNLESLVQDALRDLEPATRERNIVWQIRPLPAVQADPAMLKLALTNLLGNAVKFTRPRNPAEIEVGCDGMEGERVIVFVRDNGVGFDPQYTPKLFGVFQRLHRAEEFEGTGIGLANVRRTIARQGGRTWAEGALDHGATFYFTLKPSSPNPVK